MTKFSGHATALVADVDCTVEAEKPLCARHGVKGYPTISYGDSFELEHYPDGNEYEKMEAFIESNTKPRCHPNYVGACDDHEAALIEKFEKMTSAELGALIKKKETEAKMIEKTFEDGELSLAAVYEVIEETKNQKQAAVKASGLALWKQVLEVTEVREAKEWEEL